MKVEWRIDGENCIRVIVGGAEVVTIDATESGDREFGLWEKPEIEELLLEQYSDYLPDDPTFIML
ncbi:hypothetical protein [Brevibacillus laterosporus]|uniref:Uncharacterized protein n=1 Tax=Brevibacillus laterosporus TaxID=1465 RepID=A0AAP3DJT4_BRELA|nr:hypothetical protein [Brevibacillus laterosporus]MCR8982643.1 hypothetical protein [Brevibacillus laterosporus]MCZ0809799.1 hypothetical protein [Brevibacillus laterosporus]MCZ0828367.1 hypothetical protein [Brevibacillus laterosporus]MCZ0852377.1 hypothetical protein [Brevibacillus laterosporus]